MKGRCDGNLLYQFKISEGLVNGLYTIKWDEAKLCRAGWVIRLEESGSCLVFWQTTCERARIAPSRCGSGVPAQLPSWSWLQPSLTAYLCWIKSENYSLSAYAYGLWIQAAETFSPLYSTVLHMSLFTIHFVSLTSSLYYLWPLVQSFVLKSFTFGIFLIDSEMLPAHWPRPLPRLDTLATLFGDEIFHNSLSCQVPSVSSEELAFPRLIRCELFRLRCHGHSLFLSSYLCRIKRKENSCSACGHPLRGLTHLLDCPASEPLRHAIFDTTSIFDLWSRPWGVA